jgi:hypothetical protein
MARYRDEEKREPGIRKDLVLQAKLEDVNGHTANKTNPTIGKHFYITESN